MTPQSTPNEPGQVFTAFDVQTCLYDTKRVGYFYQSIFAAVRPGDVVVDAGSGTGVLGMLAAQAGASKVYCIEMSEEYAEVIRRNARDNKVEGKIIVIQGDATRVDLPEEVDVIISETMSGGFFYEPHIQILNNMRRFLRPGGRVIPESVDKYVELIHAQDTLYGLTFRNDTRHVALDDLSLTTRSKYLSVNFFSTSNPTHITGSVVVRGMAKGSANAIRIPYAIHFSDSLIATEPTEFLLNPQVIFLKRPVNVEPGAYYEISLSYEAASSPLSCEITVKKHPLH